MIKKNQIAVSIVNAIADVVLLVGSFFLSVVLFFSLSYPNFLDVYIHRYLFESNTLPFICLYSIVIVIFFAFFGVYKRDFARSSRNNIAILLLVNLCGLLIFAAALFVFRLVDFSRPLLLVFFFISEIFLVAHHAIFKLAIRTLHKHGHNLRHVLLVGNGKLAREYAKSIRDNSQLGFVLDGYLSLTKRDNLGEHLGSFEDLEKVLETRDIDEVVIALEEHESHFLKKVIASGDKEGVRLCIIPFYTAYLPAQLEVDVIGKSRLINVRKIPLDHLGNAALKRGIDMLISALVLVVFCWLFAILAIGVKISSPGPVFFAQERVGKNRKTFKMYKFRSMRVNADETTAWSTDEDPRKTRFGSFIRKYSLDELPQFLNVFLGDMSMVGPRPEIPYHVNHFKEEVALYMVRHQVRPGITGWAQINGYRGDTSIAGRVECDVWYVEHWSLWLDIKIIFRTICGGFKNNEKIASS